MIVYSSLNPCLRHNTVYAKLVKSFSAVCVGHLSAGMASLRRSASTTNGHVMCGDLMSGRAFDSGCTCQERSTSAFISDLCGVGLPQAGGSGGAGAYFECHCNAPRLKPQLEFIEAFMKIGNKIQSLPSKELRSKC